MNIAICDDEINDLEIIKTYIENYNSSFFSFCYNSSMELLQALEHQNFDVIFLDIEMEKPNGYETAKIIKEKNPNQLIVFTTNSLDYAIRGYGIAFRYLPKPISYDMFGNTMTQLEEIIVPQKIEIPTANKLIVVNVNNIIYFESYGHYIIFHLTDNTTIKSRNTIKSFMDDIFITYFVQIHKSYCVNLNFIDSTSNTHVQLKDGTSLPIGRSRLKDFHGALEKFVRET